MKILAGTDFHGFRPAFESFAEEAKMQEVNLVILSGDVTNFGTVDQAKSLLSILLKTDIPVFFVPGNCDPPSLINLNLNGLKCTHGVGVSYGELSFIGIGGSPITPFKTFFEMKEDEIAEILRGCINSLGSEIKRHDVILISHSPPKDTKLDRTSLGMHVGSVSIRKFIEEQKPLMVICGHIHEAKGRDSINNTVIVNPGPAKQGSCAVIMVKERKVEIEFRSLRI
ncbi:MAG: metallophosphoesterase family protein [Candidatus Bathyarchaeia archaeon]